MADDPLLQVRYVLERTLDAQIAACDHHRVGLGGDLLERSDSRQRLDLRHEMRAVRQHRSPHLHEIGSGTHERHRQEVDTLGRHDGSEPQVVVGGRVQP